MKIKTHLSTFLNILFPRRCLGCRMAGSYVCENCLRGLPFSPPLADRTNALFNYEHPLVKKAIWSLKYKGVSDIATSLGQILYDRLAEDLGELALWHPERPAETKRWLVIPIPSSKARERERGFNQAALLAKHFAHCDPHNLELSSLLIKFKNTPTQVSVPNRRQRLANVRGTFTLLNPSAVHSRNVIVIDDVITTGGTMAEARRVLKRAGARLIIAAAIAHGEY